MIEFGNNNLELDFLNTEEILSFSQKVSVLAKVTTKATAKMYLPKVFCTNENLSAQDRLYITNETISKEKPVKNAFEIKIQKAGRNNLYINFPKTLILAYKEKPTHCRLTYNPTHELWEYKLVKKEIL